jgi:hypothetical protein
MSGSDTTTTGADPTNQPTRPTAPDYVMAKVQLLLNQETAPETNVTFDTQSRADSITIKDTINPGAPYQLAWTWDDDYAREHQQLAGGDIGKLGYQINIDSYFRLDNLTDPTHPQWTLQPNPDATSNPLELATGASDAVAYHDFYRLQISFEDVWAELIDKSIGTTAQEFYAKWDALMNTSMGSDTNTTQLVGVYSNLASAKLDVDLVTSQITQQNAQKLQTEYQNVVSGYVDNAKGTISSLQTAASDAFKSAFGLSMQNIQGQLQTTLDGLDKLFTAQAGAGAPVANALDAALQIVAEMSQGAAARIAAFNAIPTQAIGGYEELETFLNNVRLILDLPTVTPPSGSAGSDSNDYEAYFYNIELGLKELIGYFDGVKLSIQAGASAGPIVYAFANTITQAITNSLSAVESLKVNALPQFMTVYGGSVNKIYIDLVTVQGSWAAFEAFAPSNISSGNVSGDQGLGPIYNLLDESDGALNDMRTQYGQQGSSGSGANNATSAATVLDFPELETLFNKLSNMLKERYSFDVFAPASINYGLLLNYRQKWQPQSYQVGSLVKTIPLGPGETRKYTTKTVVKKSRSAKELNESLRSDKEDSSLTQRTDAEIFSGANQKTDFSANASGSFKIGVYDVNASTHLDQNQGVDSKNTKRDQREAVIKTAQEFRDQHRLEVTTEESSEFETTSSSEIRNPNDELTVTYLFYELQRRYLVSESLYRTTPVILVANDVPAPHEIDEAWLVRHDWILKRVILDDSFLPALAYLGSEFAGQETALIILEMEVQHQKNVVDDLSRQVLLANRSLDVSTAGVTNAESATLTDQRTQEYSAFVKSFLDPLGISKAGTMDMGESDRARIDFANEALQRAQAKVNDLNSQMRTELTALQAAVDKYTAAATRHYAMEAQIDRVRLHVKDNIIYYMQAIWSHEPSDQRFFRLYDLDVPVFEGNGIVTVESASRSAATTASAKALLSAADTSHTTANVKLTKPTLSNITKKLHQVADVDNLIGFKGNYMIFPLVDFNNYMAWYLIHNYIHLDPTAGLMVSDPDPLADTSPDDLETALQAIYAQNPDSFAQNEAYFEEVMLRLLSDQAEQMVIVPSDQLYIEALPGTHPILEDFKLIHRALDVKKVQAEVRRAELENLRLAARLASGEYGDPDIEKKIIVETGNKNNVAILADGT